MNGRHGWAVLTLGVMTAALSACGISFRHAKPQAQTQIITVHVNQSASVSALPFRVAERLGFFTQNRLSVVPASPSRAEVVIGPAGKNWPIVGYVSIRPDMVLMAPIPDPQFRLAALNHLPMLMSADLAQEKPWLEKIFAAHHATISGWTTLKPRRINALWRLHHLPWVLVTLQEAQHLRALDSKSVVLAWLGASTGPVPSWVVTSKHTGPAVAHFLNALNLALWYLNTTPAANAASDLSSAANNLIRSTWLIKAAQHYQYWPVTTFPNQNTYDRRRAMWNSDWPAYQTAVNAIPADQALATIGK